MGDPKSLVKSRKQTYFHDANGKKMRWEIIEIF